MPLLVRPKPGRSFEETLARVAASGALLERRIGGVDAWVLRAGGGDAGRVRAELASSGAFSFVEEEGIARGGSDPTDPFYSGQWHLFRIQASTAWSAAAGLSRVPIAIVDSGVEASHPDLAGRVLPGWNYLAGTADTSDGFGHGTSVAGVAGAGANNGSGGAGVSWGSDLLPLVVLDSADVARYSDIMAAIIHAADRGVRIINVSVGGTTPSAGLQDAVDYAWSRGCVVIAAAMNNRSSEPRYPAACDKVLAVGATTPQDTLAEFSNRGPWIDLTAPGTAIYTPTWGGCYGSRNGTSFAAPVVSGIGALVLAIRPDLTPAQLVQVLIECCEDLGDPGPDATFGAGRVNAARAVALAQAMP